MRDIPENMGLNHLNANHIKNYWLTVVFAMVFIFVPVAAFTAQSATNGDLNEERWFQVELIVFAHRNKEALDSEDWPEITGLTLPENLKELTFPPPKQDTDTNDKPVGSDSGLIFEPVTTSTDDNTSADQGNDTMFAQMPVAFEMLPEEELQLRDAMKKLTHSARFEPLLHVAWRQPTYDREHAQTVLLYEGMTDPIPEAVESAMPALEQSMTNATSDEDAFTGPFNPRVIGTVQVSVERYLHLAANLVYRTQVTEQVAIPLSDLELWDDKPYPTITERQGPAFQLEKRNVMRGFRLEESRRMRSRKIHYLDNPFFGVVALITPVELPKEPEEIPTSDKIQDIPLQQ